MGRRSKLLLDIKRRFVFKQALDALPLDLKQLLGLGLVHRRPVGLARKTGISRSVLLWYSAYGA